MKAGVPKEIKDHETRVGLVPVFARVAGIDLGVVFDRFLRQNRPRARDH